MRITLSLRLSPEAHRGLSKACRAEGVSVTALFEAFGLELDRNPGLPLGDRGREVLEDARRIDQERRTRR